MHVYTHRNICAHTYMQMNIYFYLYIYIYRDGERWTDSGGQIDIHR